MLKNMEKTLKGEKNSTNTILIQVVIVLKMKLPNS